MSHEALYRKYRPRTFAELLGQDSVNRTLMNALASNHLAHAYLFCGPRGTGKTSTARLLAKALNCTTAGVEPCNQCSSCLDTGSGSSMDVIEIDAASNRGIDDIRTLRDQVRFASVGGRYKVYIIDEAHMLTTEAVNAFLKTLEEPPPNVVFVLATTEAHKVLPTVVSRCQRFDFQRIPTPVLLGRLQHVTGLEQIPVSAAALAAIAKRAGGGLRDALTLLDQVASLSIDGQAVADDLVLRVLGQVRDESLLAMGDSIASGDVVGLWQMTTEYLLAGYDPQTLVRELMQHVRNLLVMQVAPAQAAALDVPEGLQSALQGQAEAFSQADLLYCLELLNETAERMRRSSQDQIWLEAGLARLCQRQAIVSMLDLQSRVEALETAAGIKPAPRPTPRQAPVRTVAPAPAAAPPSPVTAGPAVPPAPVVTPAPVVAAPAVTPAPVVAPEPVAAAPAMAIETEPVAAASPAAVPEPAPRAPVADVAPEVRQPEPAPAAVIEPEPVVPVAVVEPEPVPVAPAAVLAPVAELEPESVAAMASLELPPEPEAAPTADGGNDELWSQLLDAIKQRHPPTWGVMCEGWVDSVDVANGVFNLAFSSSNHIETMGNSAKRVALVEGGIKAIYGHPLRLKCVERSAPTPVAAVAAVSATPAPAGYDRGPAPDRSSPGDRAPSTRQAPPAPDELDLVSEAAKIFKGKILSQP